MKYLYLVIAIHIMGCSDKSAVVQKAIEPKAEVIAPKVEVVEVVNLVESKQEVTIKELASNETMVEEVKVTKNIASDVPSSCAMWSDGSNICTRVSSRKASCTTNPVDTRMFSCLQWQ